VQNLLSDSEECELRECTGLKVAMLVQVLPRFSALLADWHPLSEPSVGLQEFKTWRPLLESDAQRDTVFRVLFLTSPKRALQPYRHASGLHRGMEVLLRCRMSPLPLHPC
jgi:hypothetical protein